MIHLPALHGLVRRRILVNYRVDPKVVARHLPPPFAPQLVEGQAIAGICLIRLEQLRPVGVPAILGLSSENAAHRIAVTWIDAAGETRHGVYISRRDTSSVLNALAGGRAFPGTYQPARFSVRDDGESVALSVISADGAADVSLRAWKTKALPSASVFPSVDAASEFFAAGAVGFSPGRGGRPDGLQLCASEWHAEALEVSSLTSGYYADVTRYPPGSVTFDSALIMRDLPHRWVPVSMQGGLP